MLEDFDTSKFYLGKLCPKKHEYKNTGKTLRYATHGCPMCGGVKTIGRAYKTVEEKFWDRVDKTSHPDGCWLWTGAIGRGGYGRFCISKHEHSYAHRFSWELKHGKIPEGMFVCHHCDNPPCVNPDHFFLGTNRDNKHDSMKKDRHARRERMGHAKLTEHKVREIRSKRLKGASYEDLASEYGVSDSLIWAVLKGRLWKEVV